jgi:hypothetical protein
MIVAITTATGSRPAIRSGTKESVMTNRTVTTAAVILSLAAAGAPAASARPLDYVPTANQAVAHVYDRPEREMVPLTATYGADVAQATLPQPVVRAQAPQSGFDWGDAGIGAAGLALSAIGVGGAFAVSQRRSRRSTALPS